MCDFFQPLFEQGVVLIFGCIILKWFFLTDDLGAFLGTADSCGRIVVSHMIRNGKGNNTLFEWHQFSENMSWMLCV